MTSWEALADAGVLSERVPIGSLTTYRLGGAARWLAAVRTTSELGSVIEGAIDRDLEVLVLGRGSNLVVSDDGFDGVVIRLTGDFKALDIVDGTAVAGAAVPLPQVARAAADAGFGGVEFYVGIPGSVGGAVAMNAGFYGTETADVLIEASVTDLRTGTSDTRSNAAFRFDYRSSAVGKDEIVTSAVFRLTPTEPAVAKATMREITQWRKERQPGGTHNAGSVFKNPEGDYAGRIIDDLGLKGFAVGAARVSVRHANFFVADADASAQDVYDLVQAVRKRVLDEAGVLLEPEIRFAGVFRRSPDEVVA